MLEQRLFWLVFAPLVLGACSSVSVPVLPAPKPALQPTAAKDETAQVGAAPVELTSVAQGTPTDVYAKVAHGALRCWFGADGPLKPTHVFHAEAKSPADGGAAEMVLHERDDAQRDRRGARAFRVAFLAEGSSSTRVVVTILRMAPQLADLMAGDVSAWAKGGEDCELRKHAQPMLMPVAGERTGPRGSR